MTAYLDAHPRVAELLGSLGILLVALVGARVVAHFVARALARRKAAPDVQHRVVDALDGPFTYAVFLVGVWAAVHRAPLAFRWKDRLDTALFVVAVAVVALAAARVYRIFLGWYAARAQAAGGDDLAREFNPMFSMVGSIFIGTVAVIAILNRFGVNVASLVVSLGVGSLAVGLAAQDTLANMFAGFTLMLDRPFRAGDRIQLASGEVGDVDAIGMRATLIKTLDDTVLVVPNSLLVKERLVNMSRPTRSVTTRLEVGVAYGSDLERVKQVLVAAARAAPGVDPAREPVVIFNRFGELAVNALLVFWVTDYTQQGTALGAAHVDVHRRLAEAGIEIPVLVNRVLREGAPPPGAVR